MPDGDVYFCIARSFEKGGYRHNAPSRHFSIGLGCNITHAKKMIYSDGMELANTTQIVPIGVGCRICPRMECEQRAHPRQITVSGQMTMNGLRVFMGELGDMT